MEKAATLAEVIYDGSTIENVSINLVENAAKTFNYKTHGFVQVEEEDPENPGQMITVNKLQRIENKPDMDNVPGIIAAQGIYGKDTTLKNVIVKCDALKDATKSIQNFRAGLNIASDCQVENLFVIGSSYTNMSIDVITNQEAGTSEYVLTLSAPQGIEPGTYTASDAGMSDYVAMAIDMFKYMKNIDVSNEIVKINFVAEPATAKFPTDAAFEAWLNGDGATAKTALLNTKMWKESGSSLVWAKDVIHNTTYTVLEGPLTPAEALTEDLTTNFFNWTGFVSYNPSITYVG